MIRRLVAAAAGVLALLAGLWLMLAPFALGNQPGGRDWTRPTTVTVLTGGAVALVGLIGFVAATAALVGLTHRYGSAPAPSAAPGSTAPGSAAPGSTAPGSTVSGADRDAAGSAGAPDGASASAARRDHDAAPAPAAGVPGGQPDPTEPDPVPAADLLAAVLPALVADLTADAGRAAPAPDPSSMGTPSAHPATPAGLVDRTEVPDGAEPAAASTEPPDAERPGTEPPGTERPGTEPSGTEPPGTEPAGTGEAGTGELAAAGAETASIGRFPRRPSVGVNGHSGPAWSGFLHPSHEPAGSTVADAVGGRGRAERYRAEVRREGA
jgi:hypothetical protein